MKLYLGIDIGTSAVKTLLIDEDQHAISSHTQRLATTRLHPLWSEQHPTQWWQAVVASVKAVVDLLPGNSFTIVAIGLTGQMHGAVLLDEDMQPLCPAMLWNDGRSVKEAEYLAATFPHLAEKLGVLPMAGLTAPKLLWLKRHDPELFKKIHVVLSPKDYISYLLTETLATDYSDASGTWLLNQHERQWSHDAVHAVGLDLAQLPAIKESIALAGELSNASATTLALRPGTPVAVGGGDTPVGALGFGCISPGEAVISLGTSAHIFTPTNSYRPAVNNLIHSFCHVLPDLWYQMGAMLNGASCLDWLSSLLGKSVDAVNLEVEALYSGPGKLLFLPYLMGERTPHNNPYARGVFFGLSPETDKRTLAQAILEGVAFSIADSNQCLQDSGTVIEQGALAGGGSKSRIWAQIIASVLQIPIIRYKGKETGPAFGAARLARISIGDGDATAICQHPVVEEIIEPETGYTEMYIERHRQFQRLYEKLRTEFVADHN